MPYMMSLTVLLLNAIARDFVLELSRLDSQGKRAIFGHTDPLN